MHEPPTAPERGLMQRLARYAQRHYYQVFLVTAVLLAISGVLISRLRFDTDVLNLLPKNDPALNAYISTLADFGTFDYLLITVAIPEGTAVDPYEAFADALAPRLAEIPEIEAVEHRIDDPEKLIEGFLPQAMLFVSDEDRTAVAKKLSTEGLSRRAAELRRLISTPQSIVLRDLIRLDPAGLAEMFIGRIESGQGSMSVDWMSGYYLSQDQRLLLVLAKPRQPPQNIAFDQALYAKVQAAITATTAEWPTMGGREEAPLVKVGGPHVSAMFDERLIKEDMQLNGYTSMALVLVVFVIAFRRLGTMIYAFLPLTVGLALTFAFSSLVFGVLSSATSGTAALLAGLGVDFVVVAYGRFVEERNRGRTFDQALDVVMTYCARGIVVGALTTAASFYAFTFTDFTGLRQMGILTGTGILFCLAAVLVLLPAMLGWSEARHSKRLTQPKLYLHSFGVGRLIRFCFRYPRAVLAAGAVITLASGVLALNLKFQDSWRQMRPAGNQGVEVEEEVQAHFKSEFDYMMLLFSGPDLDALLERTELATAKAKKLVADGVLTGVSSLTTLVPAPSKQQQALTWLTAGRQDGSLDPARIRTDFETALAAEGLRPEPFAHGLDLLTKSLSPSQPIHLGDLGLEGQAGQLVGRLLRQKNGQWQSVVKLYQPGERWRRQAPPEAHALAAEVGPDAILTGANVVSQIMRDRVRRDAWIGMLLGTLLVFLLSWADFRDVRLALFCQVPLAVGVLWMLGGMVLFGLQMNFMNVFVTTMILGIGVDYGLHMMHRYNELKSEGGDIAAGLAETGNAVVVAALTTIAGFGSLAVSHYPGLRSTGYVATIGAISTLIVAVALLPAYLALRVKRHTPAAG